MLGSLMRDGGYRVDLINRNAAGRPGSFGLYVRGDLPLHAIYSTVAKHHLLAGLDYIQKALDPGNLLAVYIDISRTDTYTRPAYARLKRDIQAGSLRKILVYQLSDLVESEESYADLLALDLQVGGIEVLTLGSGKFMFNDLVISPDQFACTYERGTR